MISGTSIIRRLIILVICISFIMTPFQRVIARRLNLESDTPRTAKVIEVIDGEVIRVMYYYSDFQMPEIKIIKLLGIDTKGNQDAFEYTLTTLLGQVVFILEEDRPEYPDINQLDISYGYVYNQMSRSINEELLMQGYAVTDLLFMDSLYYDDLRQAEEVAIEKELGFYATSDESTVAMFNINTASFNEMQQYLVDTSDEAINAIIAYRTYNMFESVEEVKFAHESLDHDWLEENRGIFNAITNINSANVYELASLFPDDADGLRLAEAIEQYKVFNDVLDKDELKHIEEVTTFYYDIAAFIDTQPEDKYVNEDHKVANVNTCSVFDLMEATDLPELYATKLQTERSENDYYYKNVGELVVEGAALYSETAYRFTDNLSALTNVNTANIFELTTLFGLFDGLSTVDKEAMAQVIVDNRPYEEISDIESVIEPIYYSEIWQYLITGDQDRPKSMNLNLTDVDTLDDYLGMSYSDENKHELYLKDHTYVTPSNIQIYIKGKGRKISLFTDINTATEFELLNLNRNMSEDIVADILDFRRQEPITSLEEIQFIFADHNRSYLYLELKDFVVFN